MHVARVVGPFGRQAGWQSFGWNVKPASPRIQGKIGTPGGFRVGFTGMRVTGHDGTSPHHLVGVRPDVVVAPTVEGLRAGRDEVLERGLAVVR